MGWSLYAQMVHLTPRLRHALADEIAKESYEDTRHAQNIAKIYRECCCMHTWGPYMGR